MVLVEMFPTLLIHIAIGLILCVPPLIPLWKSLAQRFNEKEITNKKIFSMILLSLGIAITIATIISITFHHGDLLRPEFPPRAAMELYFHIFALFSFFLLPLGVALVGCSAYLWYSSNPKVANFVIILLALLAIGLAGSFLHDLLWCGTKTSFFTVQADAGYDLNWWWFTVGGGQFHAIRDYRVFSFFQFLLISILLCYATILLWRHGTLQDKAPTKKSWIFSLILSTSVFVLLGVALYIMDYSGLFDFPWAFTSVYIMIPLTLPLAFFLGKNLSS